MLGSFTFFRLYKVYIQYLAKFQECVPHTITSKKFHVIVCPQILRFRGATQQRVYLKTLNFHRRVS